MEAILGVIAANLAPTLAAAIGSVLIWLLNKFVLAPLAAKTNDQRKLALLSALADFAELSVHATEQTVVDSLKKSGEWGKPEGYQKALTEALSTLRVQAASVLPELAKMGVQLGEAELTTLIEASIKKVQIK